MYTEEKGSTLTVLHGFNAKQIEALKQYYANVYYTKCVEANENVPMEYFLEWYGTDDVKVIEC